MHLTASSALLIHWHYLVYYSLLYQSLKWVPGKHDMPKSSSWIDFFRWKKERQFYYFVLLHKIWNPKLNRRAPTVQGEISSSCHSSLNSLPQKPAAENHWPLGRLQKEQWNWPWHPKIRRHSPKANQTFLTFFLTTVQNDSTRTVKFYYKGPVEFCRRLKFD